MTLPCFERTQRTWVRDHLDTYFDDHALYEVRVFAGITDENEVNMLEHEIFGGGGESDEADE